MSKPKKIAVRYIESNAKKKGDTKDDDAKALKEKLEASDAEGCAFC